MAIEIDALELRVESESASAEAKIARLAAALEDLRQKTSGGAGNLTKHATAIAKINAAITGSASANASAAVFAKNLRAIVDAGQQKISSSIAKQIASISSATNSISPKNAANLRAVGGAINAFASIDKTDGLKTILNQLNRIPKVLEKLDDGTLDRFEHAMKSVSASVTPLSNKLVAMSPQLDKLTGAMKATSSAASAMSKSNRLVGQTASENVIKIGAFIHSLKTVGMWLGKAISLTNNYVEDMNLFTVSMGRYANAAGEYAEKVADVMGIDPATWMRNQGVFQTLSEGFGVTSDRAEIMSRNLTQLGYDLSSFFNIAADDAMQKLQSGISGELEPLRRLGYDLSDARLKATALSLGIDKATASMTQAEKAQLRYYAIMTQVTTAQGDMARTLNAPANQLRVLQAQVTQAGRAIGSIFIPMLNAVLPPAIAVMQVIRGVATAIASLFGYSLPEIEYSAGLDNISAGANNAAESLGGAAGAAKELQKYVMGFDELNIIPDQKSGGGGGGGGAGGGSLSGFDFELPEYDFLADAVSSNVDKIYRKIKPFGDWIIDNLDTILSLGEAIGGALLAWNVAKTFVPNLKLGAEWLGKIKGYAGAAAAIAISATVSYHLSNEFLGEDGTYADLIGSGLSAALGGVIAARSFHAMSPGSGAYGASLSLGITALTTIVAGLDETKAGEFNKRTFLNSLLGVLEAAAGGALFGFKVGGVKGAVAGAVISAGLSIVAQIGAVLEGIKRNNIKKNLNWGDVELTRDEMRKEAESMFGLDVTAHINVTDSFIDEEKTAREQLNATILRFEGKLNPIKLGVDTSEEALNGLASQANSLITQLQTLLSTQQGTIEYAMSLVPVSGEGGTDSAGILAASGIASATLSAGAAEIGNKLSQALADGMVDGLSAEEQRLITEYSASLARIAQAVSRGEMTSEFAAETGLLLTDLNMDSFEGVLAEYKTLESELEASFRSLGIQVKADMGGQVAGLTEYLGTIDAAADPVRYQEVYDQLQNLIAEYNNFNIEQYIADAMSGAVGPAHEEWKNAIAKIFVIDNSVMPEMSQWALSDFIGGLTGAWAGIGGEYDDKIKTFANSFQEQVAMALEDTFGKEGYQKLLDASEMFGFTQWDVLSADLQSQFYDAMVSAIGAEATSAIFEQLGYSIPGLINDGVESGGEIEITPVVNATQAETDLGVVQDEISKTSTAAETMQSAVSENATSSSAAVTAAYNESTSAWSGFPSWYNTNVVTPVSNAFDGIDWRKMGADAVSRLKTGLTSISLPKFRIQWDTTSRNFQFNGNTTTMTVPLPNLKFYAQGGFPKSGEMFVANESGAEMVGRIGQRTAVANQEQIGDAIFRYMDEHDSSDNQGMTAEQLAAAMVAAMRAAGLGTINIGGREIVRAINQYTQQSGKPAVT